MRLQFQVIVFLGFLSLPGIATAQIFAPLTSMLGTANDDITFPGSVDIIVEGETYKPSFYTGRAEPTVGNVVRFVAVPSGRMLQDFTYQWSVNGNGLAATGPVATFSDLFSGKLRVSVNVIDKNGALWARKEETISLSKPQVVFYEENILRGHGSRAITDNHVLIGEEGVIRAEPYFIGLQADPASYRTAWKINGGPADSGDDWRQLLIQRPQNPLANYRIEFSARNASNLAEMIGGRFNLNFGL